MIDSRIVAIAGFCLWASIAAFSADLETALSRLEASGAGRDLRTAAEDVATIRAEMSEGDVRTWARLRRILNEAALPLSVRWGVLDVAMEKSDKRIASDMIILASEWADQIGPFRSIQEHAPDAKRGNKALLLGRFVSRLSESPWTEWVGAKQETLALLQAIYLETACSLETKYAALQALATSPAPVEKRRAVAEAVVAAKPRSGELPAVLLSLLDASSMPKLRELVRASADVESFHYGAAAALGHLGDREILPDLEAARPMLRAKHVNLERYVIHYIWQINIQHPPSSLLDYVASTEFLSIVAWRSWAVRRAVELDVPKDKIRQALLKHAKQVKPKTVRQRSGRTVKIWPGLSTLTEQGLRLGILHAGDLPEVQVPKVRPSP